MYAFCQDMPGVTLDEYARLEALIPADALAACVAHVVGPIDGGVRMVDVWTDEASYRRFQTEVLWPTLDRLPQTMPAPGSAPPVFSVVEVSGEDRLATVRT